MSPEEIRDRIPFNELKFSTSRSGGPGGQNVNKVSTKVELRFNITDSASFTDYEKALILDILKNRINNELDLLIISQSARTQLQNRKKAEENLYKLLARALTVKPERKPTKPTKASKTKRLEKKKKRSNIKRFRKSAGTSEDDI
jgi:ribosome-associated protein